MDREFRLAAPGFGRGVTCDANGAFIGTIPLLKQDHTHGKDHWEPCDCGQLSDLLSEEFGVPVDLSSKMSGLQTIARALADGNIARAQVATLLLGIPNPPPLSKGIRSPNEWIRFIRDLSWSGMIKGDWDPADHPRWPAGAPNSEGGQFAPKAENQVTSTAEENDECNRTQTNRRRWSRHYGKDWPRDPKRPGRYQEVAHIKARADGGGDEPTNIRPLPRDEHIKEHKENGDYSRWGKRSWTARAFGGKASPGPKPSTSPPPQNSAPKTAPPLEEQITPEEIPLDELPLFVPE